MFQFVNPVLILFLRLWPHGSSLHVSCVHALSYPPTDKDLQQTPNMGIKVQGPTRKIWHFKNASLLTLNLGVKHSPLSKFQYLFFFFFFILNFSCLCDEPRRSLPHERSTMQQFQPILGQKYYGMYICVNFARLPALSQVFYSRLSYNSQVKPRREKIEFNNCKGIKPPQSHKKKENIRSPWIEILWIIALFEGKFVYFED